MARQLSFLVLFCALILMLSPASAQTFDRPSATDADMTTGPVVGARIPDFAGVDQHGHRLGWKDIKGPNGAIIVFYRSADW